MKTLKVALLMSVVLLFWVVKSYADRLYTWTDAKGVTHITQEPPTDTAKVVDTIDYSPQPNRPVNGSTGSDQTNQQLENLVQRSEQSGTDSGSGLTSGDDLKDIQYEGDSYRRTLLRYEIKHKIFDDHESDKDRHHPRKR